MNYPMVRIANTTVWVSLLAACIGAALAATPAQQQAIVQTGNGGPEVLKLQTIPVLEPGDGQLLIRVYAASVNPADWKARIGIGRPATPAPAAAGAAASPPVCAPTTQRIPGLDVAGVVAKVGPGVKDLRTGEAVLSRLARTGPCGLNGGYSEYVIAPAVTVVAKPKNLTYAQAAGLGVVGMTGVRTVDQAMVTKGQRVLITGVAGGVGSSAAQVAIARGAHVIGTASPRHAAFLKSIGVKDVIDYTQGNWADKVKDVDVVIDTVGGDTALMAFNTVKKGGTFVTVASRDITPEKCTAAGVTCPVAGASPTEGDLLKAAVALASRGKLKVHVDKVFMLARAADAQEYNRDGHTEGKVVLAVTERANQK